MDLDEIDLKILRVLQQSGRITTVELADKVCLSPSPCARRVRILEEAGVITGYRAVVDQEKLGYPITVFVTVELERKNAANLQNFERSARKFPEVIQGYVMTGSQDFLLCVVVADLHAFEFFIQEKLARIDGIRSMRSQFALRRILPNDRLPG